MIPSIDILSDFVRTIDVHASQRLALLDRAGRVLAGREVASQEAREDLAATLERWRYQHLNERGPTLGREDRQLADTLDLTANRLAGRAERAPRAARLAIADPQFDPPGIGGPSSASTPASRWPRPKPGPKPSPDAISPPARARTRPATACSSMRRCTCRAIV
jgi:hypothetical protein